jgi:hypothetical protein
MEIFWPSITTSPKSVYGYDVIEAKAYGRVAMPLRVTGSLDSSKGYVCFRFCFRGRVCNQQQLGNIESPLRFIDEDLYGFLIHLLRDMT